MTMSPTKFITSLQKAYGPKVLSGANDMVQHLDFSTTWARHSCLGIGYSMSAHASLWELRLT